MMAKKKKLGRGLAALLGDDAADIIAGTEMRIEGSVTKLPLDQLAAGKMQPRRHFDDDALSELIASVKEHGILQPLLVRKKGARYEIIAGERRFRAAMKANISHVPVVALTMDDDTALQVGLVENLQRKDLDPLEEAMGYVRLGKEFGRTQNDIARLIGKSRPHITNMMRLLSLPQAVQELLRHNKLSIGHARLLIGRKDAVELARIMVKKNMSVRQAEQLIRDQEQTKTTKTKASKDPDIANLEKNVSNQLGLKTEIRHGRKGGKVVIHYQDLDQFETLMDKIRS